MEPTSDYHEVEGARWQLLDVRVERRAGEADGDEHRGEHTWTEHGRRDEEELCAPRRDAEGCTDGWRRLFVRWRKGHFIGHQLSPACHSP